MQVFKPKNFHGLRRILNVVSCNQISLEQKVKKKETELDGMVVLKTNPFCPNHLVSFEKCPSFILPCVKGAPGLGCSLGSR